MSQPDLKKATATTTTTKSCSDSSLSSSADLVALSRWAKVQSAAAAAARHLLNYTGYCSCSTWFAAVKEATRRRALFWAFRIRSACCSFDSALDWRRLMPPPLASELVRLQCVNSRFDYSY